MRGRQFQNGHVPSPEMRAKISATLRRKGVWNRRGRFIPCALCGRKLWVKPSEEGRSKYCSRECTDKGRPYRGIYKPGPQHPNYIDGRAKCPYASGWTKALKRQIRERDGFRCVLCGITEEDYKAKFGKALSVNHIDYNKHNCAPSNLNTLCQGCNARINWNREHWTRYFQMELAQRIGAAA